MKRIKKLSFVIFWIILLNFFGLNYGRTGEKTVIDIDKAVEIALNRNEGLKATRANIEKARGELISARAGFLPSVTASGSHVYLDEKMQTTAGIDPITGTMITKSLGRDQYSLTGSIKQAVFTGFRNYSSYNSAGLNLDLQKTNYQSEKNELAFKVKEAYYRAVLAEEMVSLNREAYRQLKEHVRQTKKRYDDGLVSRLELLRARVEAENQEPKLTEAKNLYQQTRSSFKSLLSIEPDKNIKLKDSLETREEEFKDIELNAKIKKALKNNPRIQALKLQKKMAEKRITTARSQRYPSIFAVYNYNYEKPAQGINDWDDSWNIMLQMELPIFTGFATHGKIKSAKAGSEKLKHSIGETEKNTALAVENAVLKIEKEKETIQSQQKNVKQAGEALDIANKRYRNGLISNIEYMDTQLSLTRARINLLNAKADYFIALASLEKVTGGEN
ncbi:MAG: TolC family protein [Elusimicrobiota bacterium]